MEEGRHPQDAGFDGIFISQLVSRATALLFQGLWKVSTQGWDEFLSCIPARTVPVLPVHVIGTTRPTDCCACCCGCCWLQGSSWSASLLGPAREGSAHQDHRPPRQDRGCCQEEVSSSSGNWARSKRARSRDGRQRQCACSCRCCRPRCARAVCCSSWVCCNDSSRYYVTGYPRCRQPTALQLRLAVQACCLFSASLGCRLFKNGEDLN